MNIKKLIFSLALGALAFASCEKPENPVEPTPDPVLADVKTTAHENTVTISGAVSEFTFTDDKTTPVGVWSSLDKGAKKTEVAGTYNAEKKLVEGSIKNLEYEKAYTFGTFVTVDGKKFYSKGAELTLSRPITAVVFSDVKATADKQTVKVSAKTAEFTYVDAEKTAVGIWYIAEGKTEKVEIAGTYNKETSLIEGSAKDIAYGTYTFGVYANEDGKKQYSEGVKVTLEAPVTPVKFSDVKATAEKQTVKVSAQTADFTYVDAEKTAVGIWYTAEGKTEKVEIAGTYNKETSLIEGSAKDIAYGTYTFGVYANEDGKKQYSEGVKVVIEKPAEPVKPIEFKDIKADVKDKDIKVTALTVNFEFIDETSTPVGIWYSTDNGKTKTEVAGTWHADTKVISGTAKGLAYADYTVGAFVTVKGTKTYSAGIQVKLEKPAVNPGYHIPDFNNGIDF